MGRKPYAAKHPAHIAKLSGGRGELLAREAAENAALEQLEGWNTFSSEEKRFLSVVAGFSTETQAARHMGKSPRWVTEHKAGNYLFKVAVSARKEQHDFIATRMTEALMRKAVAAYDYVLTQKDGKYTEPIAQVLAAATNVIKMSEPKESAEQGTRVYASQVQMFQFNNAPKNLQEAATGDDEH